MTDEPDEPMMAPRCFRKFVYTPEKMQFDNVEDVERHIAVIDRELAELHSFARRHLLGGSLKEEELGDLDVFDDQGSLRLRHGLAVGGPEAFRELREYLHDLCLERAEAVCAWVDMLRLAAMPADEMGAA